MPSSLNQGGSHWALAVALLLLLAMLPWLVRRYGSRRLRAGGD